LESVVILLLDEWERWSSENDFFGDIIGGFDGSCSRWFEFDFWKSDWRRIIGVEVLDNDWACGDFDSLELFIGLMILIKGDVSIFDFIKLCEWDDELWLWEEDWCSWIEFNVSSQKVNYFVK